MPPSASLEASRGSLTKRAAQANTAKTTIAKPISEGEEIRRSSINRRYCERKAVESTTGKVWWKCVKYAATYPGVHGCKREEKFQEPSSNLQACLQDHEEGIRLAQDLGEHERLSG